MADVLKDSLFNERKTRIIDELQTKYETEKKEQQIKILNVQNRSTNLQRNIFFIIAITILFALFASIFIFFQQRRITSQKLHIQDSTIATILQEQTIKTYNAMMIGQEEERKRVAVDLHDRLGSMLATVRAYFSASESSVINDDSENHQLHKKATSLLDQTLDEVRTIANNLNSGLIADLGLRPAIEDLCESISQSSGLDCKAFFYNLEDKINNQTEIAVYRIIQELVSNTVKHAKAKNITIQINRVDESLQVTIEDDGIGYDYAQKIKSPGMGLKNIVTRVEKLDGTFHVESKIGEGSFTSFYIPLKTEELPIQS